MNTNEYLLTCLIEECAEIQHAASKALRFGKDEVASHLTASNSERVAAEINDLIAIVELAEEAGVLCRGFTLADIARKKIKVRAWMEYSKQVGALRD